MKHFRRDSAAAAPWALTLLGVAFIGCYGDRYVGVSGKVIDENGIPIEGAKVTLRLESERSAGSEQDEDTTDSSGSFSVGFSSAPGFRRTDAILTIEKEAYEPYEERIGSSSGFLTRRIVLHAN